MKGKLHLASIFTLILLSGFVVSIILAASYFLGFISWPLMIILTIIFNLLIWLIGPYISDLIYKIFYKINFYNPEELQEQHYFPFIKEVCERNKIKIPRVGIIKDQNPTAFTYGSASFNARVVLTEGLFTYLNEDEQKAVIAHELGHIANKDFIIMTIAHTLIQILYQNYVVFTKTKSKKSKKGNPLFVIGITSYIFYLIGSYVVLYLSRLREYYADEFSTRETGDPNLLSAALIKIAYGIVKSSEGKRTSNLLKSTRAQGIFDFKAAKDTGLIFQNSGGKRELIEKSLLFDLVNPWAALLQLKSTHPLIGRRIRRLCKLTQEPLFNFKKLLQQPIDKKKLWGNFFKDVLVQYSILLVLMGTAVSLGLQISHQVNYYLPTIGLSLALLLIVTILKVRYRFSGKGFKETDILSCMADIYASPVRGKPVILQGQGIGRGEAGYIFGEDMMFQDRTGLIYLNYESGVPLLGNLLFAWKKLKKLLGRPAIAKGWFMRGMTHHIELHRFSTEGETIKSYVRFWYIFGNLFVFALLFVIVLFILMKLMPFYLGT